jgi:hypothetical protein
MRKEIAEIGYRSPSGATLFFNRFGEVCSGAGYAGKMYDGSSWMEIKRGEYSISYSFATLEDFKKHFENI